MVKDTPIWIALLDRRGGRILRGSAVPKNRYHFDLVDTFENQEEEHQHGRPSPRRGKAGHSYATWGDEDAELLQRYARSVSAWLQGAVDERGIDHLEVFAPARLLGVLRRVCPSQLARRMTEHEGELAHVAPGDLARHPVIARLVG